MLKIFSTNAESAAEVNKRNIRAKKKIKVSNLAIMRVMCPFIFNAVFFTNRD